MGDYVSPQKRELVDRFKRRFESYKQHHPNALARCERAIKCLYSNQGRATDVYHRKWLESKAKKAAKSSRTSKDGSSSQNNQLQLKKRKLDSTSSATSEAADQPSASYVNTECESPATKRTKSESEAHVSVQIYQKSSQPDSHINVTVSSTFKSGNTSSPSGQQIHTSTSVECKTEPKEEPNPNSVLSPHGSENDLDDILDLISNETIFDKDLQNLLENAGSLDSEEIPEDLNMFSPGSMHHAGSPLVPPPEYSDSLGGHPDKHSHNRNNTNNNGNNLNGVHRTPPVSMATTSPLPGYQPTPVPHSMPPSSQGHPQATPVSAPYFNQPTGPAAETLKQLAMKNSQGSSMMSYQRQGSFTGYSGQSNFNGPAPPPTPANVCSFNSPVGPRQTIRHKGPEGLSYGGTKPLSHFSEPMARQPMRPPHMVHPQSQGGHLQVNHIPSMVANGHSVDGRQHVQMSQQMQARLQGRGHLSMSQQQSFTLAQSQEAALLRNEQIKMKMLQQQKLQQEHQQQQQQQQQQQMQAAAMNVQYPNRPPPEYKMPQGNATAYQLSAQGQQGSNHPLQPIQNMIKQTSETFSSAMQQGGIYGTVKTENPGQPVTSMQAQGNGQSQPLTHLPPMRNSSPHISGPHHDGFQGQQIARQQNFSMKLPQGGPHSIQAGQVRPMKPVAPTYTSALMRNERPPNVDVGPTGLNISQQRTLAGEWAPRAIPPNYQPPMVNMAARVPVQYGYPSQQAGPRGSPMGSTMHPQHHVNIQMAQQQQSMMRASHTNAAASLQHDQMLLQQRQQQQQSLRITSDHARGPPLSSRTVNMSASQSVSFSQPLGSHGDNFPNLDFLDNAQHGGGDFLDQMAQSGEYNLLDDILGT